ncbi:MAG: hypothetical protein ACOC1P_00300 [Minisyncoccales bacterium]
MKKNIFFIFLIILSANMIYGYQDPSQIIGGPDDDSEIFYTADDVRYYLGNQTFSVTLKNLYDEIIKSNFTKNYVFQTSSIRLSGDLYVYLGNSDIIDEIFESEDVFGVASRRDGKYFLGIDVENIYSYYNLTPNDVNAHIENTFLHELAHILHYEYKNELVPSLEYLFNISATQIEGKSDNLGFGDFYFNNRDYFENISIYVGGEVGDGLADSVRFPNVYNTYIEYNHIDETIVRIIAVCFTQETDINNIEGEDFKLLIPTEYDFCDRFPNLYHDDPFNSQFRLYRTFDKLYKEIVLDISKQIYSIPERELITQSSTNFVQKFNRNKDLFGWKYLLFVSGFVITQLLLFVYLIRIIYKRFFKN